jgi:hypothetical protein
VAIYSVWLLAAEIIRPELPHFPATPAAAAAASTHQSSATLAANIAVIRGDLWTGAAISIAASFGYASATANQSQPPGEPNEGDASPVLERAASWSPHDARVWLLLAAAGTRRNAPNPRVAEWLRLSYFTGSNETDLMPLRLAALARSGAVNDPDLRQFGRQEIQAIVSRLPNLRPAVAEAYRAASPEGKRFMAEALMDLNPEFLNSIAGPSPARSK